MAPRNRSNLAVGVLLIVLGGWFLAVQFVPGLAAWVNVRFAWPLIVAAVGLGLFVFGLLVGAPGMVIPACIVGGIGGILYWQSVTGNWASWSYAWALIPGFVGVGVMADGLLEGHARQSFTGGAWLIVISAVLFLVFGSIFGGVTVFGPYWPVLLIILGVIGLVRALSPGR
jgi:hypothetical protein